MTGIFIALFLHAFCLIMVFYFFSGIIGKVRNSDEQVGKRASVKDPNKMKGKKREE